MEWLVSEIRKLPNEEICLTGDVISGRATSLICRESAQQPQHHLPGHAEELPVPAAGAACLAPAPRSELLAGGTTLGCPTTTSGLWAGLLVPFHVPDHRRC